MRWRVTAHLLDLKVPPLTAHAFDYLESKGLRFCVHFGTKNAIDLATDKFVEAQDAQVSNG